LAEGAVAVLRLGALVEQVEVDAPRLDGNAEEELALAEEVLAASDLRAGEREPRPDVAEEEAGRGLERFARGHQRIEAAMAFVDERSQSSRNLGEGLLHQAVAAIVARTELTSQRRQPVQVRRDADVVGPIVGPHDGEQPVERKE